MRFQGGPGIGLAAALALAACTASGDPQPTRFSPATAAGPLPHAEQIGEDLVMAPVGRDPRGCVQYQVRSNTRPTLQAVFYRTRAGDFSTIKEEAACS